MNNIQILLKCCYRINIFKLELGITRKKGVMIITKTCLSNVLKIYHQKENFQIKNRIFFRISALNIDYGHSLESSWCGDSNENPQSMCFIQFLHIVTLLW